jgi:hypothetical protein
MLAGRTWPAEHAIVVAAMAVVWPPHAPTDLVAALADQARSLGSR